MPFFDYLCKTCEHIEENVLVKKFDEVNHCEKCGTELKRLLSTPAGHMFKEHGGTDRGRVMSFKSSKNKNVRT